MLREQEPRNSFTTVNEPEKGQWTFSDIAEIARFTGAEPVLVDQIYGASSALSLFVGGELERRALTPIVRSLARRGQPGQGRALHPRGRARRAGGQHRAAQHAPHLRRHLVRCSPAPLSPRASRAELTLPLSLLALAPRYRFALSLATAFMFFRLMRRPTSVTAAQYRSASKQL